MIRVITDDGSLPYAVFQLTQDLPEGYATTKLSTQLQRNLYLTLITTERQLVFFSSKVRERIVARHCHYSDQSFEIHLKDLS